MFNFRQLTIAVVYSKTCRRRCGFSRAGGFVIRPPVAMINRMFHFFYKERSRHLVSFTYHRIQSSNKLLICLLVLYILRTTVSFINNPAYIQVISSAIPNRDIQNFFTLSFSNSYVEDFSLNNISLLVRTFIKFILKYVHIFYHFKTFYFQYTEILLKYIFFTNVYLNNKLSDWILMSLILLHLSYKYFYVLFLLTKKQ